MKKFKFQLETVRKLKKVKEESALRELATAQQNYLAEIEKKTSLVNDLRKSQQRKEELAIKPVQISEFQSEEDFICGTKQRILQAEQSILRTNRIVQKMMKAYLLARRDSRSIETLFEQAQAEFKKSKAKAEQKELDDLILMRARFKEEII
jgi:flagellar export protein FliJ